MREIQPRKPQSNDRVMRAFLKRYCLTPEQASNELKTDPDLIRYIAQGGGVHFKQWEQIRMRMAIYIGLKNLEDNLDALQDRAHLTQTPEPFMYQ